RGRISCQRPSSLHKPKSPGKPVKSLAKQTGQAIRVPVQQSALLGGAYDGLSEQASNPHFLSGVKIAAAGPARRLSPLVLLILTVKLEKLLSIDESEIQGA